jgi:hypothetical protein
MTFHKQMVQKQKDKDSKCVKRIINYIENSVVSNACKKCNCWKHYDIGFACLRHSANVFKEHYRAGQIDY